MDGWVDEVGGACSLGEVDEVEVIGGGRGGKRGGRGGGEGGKGAGC